MNTRNQLIGLMIYLIYISIEDDTKDLYLFIYFLVKLTNTGGRSLLTMQFVDQMYIQYAWDAPLQWDLFILVGGRITKRLAFP